MAFCLCFKPDLGISDRYDIKRRVGQGGTGDVYLATEVDTGAAFALKVQEAGRHLRPADAARIIREVQLSVELGEGHVNIIRPHELILTNRHLVLATEYGEGGTLEAFAKRRRIDEDLALYLFLQVVGAVQHCHRKNIVYRDVKLVNVLLDSSEPPVVQLCDFGVSRKIGHGKKQDDIHKLTTFAGTAGFLSPEVIAVGLTNMGADPSALKAQAYDGTKSDVWSLGVLLFVMLVHQLPFFVDELDLQLDPAHALNRALTNERCSRWTDALGPAQRTIFFGLSAEVQDLMGRMFDRDEATRASIDDVLKHPWCQRELPSILQSKLDQLRDEQAKIDSEADRPRYSAEDGDKLVAKFVDQVFTPEYRAKAKMRGRFIVDRMMLTWSGLPHSSLPAAATAAWAGAEVTGSDPGAGSAAGCRAEKQKRFTSSSLRVSTDAEDAGGWHTSGSLSPSRRTPERVISAEELAKAPYKARRKISTIMMTRAGSLESVKTWSVSTGSATGSPPGSPPGSPQPSRATSTVLMAPMAEEGSLLPGMVPVVTEGVELVLPVGHHRSGGMRADW